MNKPTILGVLYLVFVIGITACETDSSGVTGSESGMEDEPLAEQVGTYHNIALDEILQDEEMQKLRDDYPMLRRALIHKLSDRDPEIFNREALLEKADQMHERLTATGLLKVQHKKDKQGESKKITSFEFNFSKLFGHMREKGQISDSVYWVMTDIYNTYSDNRLNKKTFKEVKQRLNEAARSEQDQKVVSSFLQVLKASDTYWSVYNATDMSSVQDLCSLSTIWIDAAGGAYGMILGPIWSLIEGALFSSFSHMYCSTNS